MRFAFLTIFASASMFPAAAAAAEPNAPLDPVQERRHAFAWMNKLDFLANPKGAKGAPSQWSFNEMIKNDKRVVRHQFGATTDIADWKKGVHPDLEKALSQVLSAEADSAIKIEIHVVPEWRE